MQDLQGPASQEPVLHVCRAAAVGNLADALSLAFRRGLPGFALPTAALLSLQVLFNLLVQLVTIIYYILYIFTLFLGSLTLFLCLLPALTRTRGYSTDGRSRWVLRQPCMCLCCAQAARGDEEDAAVQAAVHSVVDQLEALAVSSAAGELTSALLPALEHTLGCMRGAPPEGDEAGDPEDAAGVWMCLADLFCSTDARSAQARDVPMLMPQ
jgi:hypothetical protein